MVGDFYGFVGDAFVVFYAITVWVLPRFTLVYEPNGPDSAGSIHRRYGGPILPGLQRHENIQDGLRAKQHRLAICKKIALFWTSSPAYRGTSFIRQRGKEKQ